MERKRKEREISFEKMEAREKVMQREKRWERIRNSSYNRWYGLVKGEGILEGIKEKDEGRIDGEGW